MKNSKLNFKKENLTKLNKQDLKKVVGGSMQANPTSVYCTTRQCTQPKKGC